LRSVRVSSINMATGIASFRLRLGPNESKCELRLPEGPVRVADVLPALYAITGLVIETGIEEAESAGRTVTCKAGCGACCRQSVPISVHEAEALLQVISGMDEARREKVKTRFEDALRKIAGAGMLDDLRRIAPLQDEARREIARRYFALGIACPFLENEACSIYENRPIRCREYLVTSPAEHCADPSPETVEVTPLRGAPLQALYTIGAGDSGTPPDLFPMILLPEWQGPSESAQLPAPKILQSFLTALGGVAPEPIAKPD